MLLVQSTLQWVLPYLVWPVIAALAWLYVVTIVSAGATAGEAWRRWRGYVGTVARMRQSVAALAKDHSDKRDFEIEALLQRYEGKQLDRINRLRAAIRLGPSLGLIGTLIPMAKALAELANGNLPALAQNMVNAFASTVLGIALSVFAYGLAVTREAWMRHDDRELRLYAERMVMEANSASSEEPV